MIFLKPIEGLCNRMRTIDSFISLCKKHKKELTIIWVNDPDINCSFNTIFKPFASKNIRVIEVPYGFPEFYVTNFDSKYANLKLKKHKKTINTSNLNEDYLFIKNTIEQIPDAHILLCKELRELYNSKSYQNVTTNTMDSIFFNKVTQLIHPLINNSKTDCYIESCYRVHPQENNYTNFILQENITKKINTITKKFDNTIGIHIRRTDHRTAIKNSSTNKFINEIEKHLLINPNTTFFLATDNAKTKQDLLTKYSSKIITNTFTEFNRNNENAILNSVIDLYCLANTTKILGSHHSTFSQTAAHIGNISENTVN